MITCRFVYVDGQNTGSGGVPSSNLKPVIGSSPTIDYLEGRTNGVLQATKCQQPGPDSQTLERLMDLENRVSRTERSNYSNVSNW